MSQVAASKGSWFLKALGVVTVLGILIAVGSIILKVFAEGEGSEPDAPNGV